MGGNRNNRVLFKNHKDSVHYASRNFNPSQEGDIIGQPPYKIGGIDLSALWVSLVRQNKVSASMALPSNRSSAGDNTDRINDDENNENVMVEYGIKIVEKNTQNPHRYRLVYEEYVEQLGLQSNSTKPNSVISNINATLTRRQQQDFGSGVNFEQVGNFVAQLQLIRTLRPPQSEGFREATSSYPPTYDWKTDSFVTGPLRLELRPLVAQIKLASNCNDDKNKEDKNDEGNNLLKTSWDVFHNISPADRRGHFLLLPSLSNKERNWRGQYLTKDDCSDLVHIAGSIEPAGSMFLGYNSVGAGASQNHIHCHSWPIPNFGSEIIDKVEEVARSFTYAINKVDLVRDVRNVDGGKVKASYLNYPVFCVKLSSSVANLNSLGKSLATCIEAIGGAPHNVGLVNRNRQIDDFEEHKKMETMVDVFVFARSKERSSFVSTLKLGISEMMGVFHAQSESELKILTQLNEDTRVDGRGLKRKCTMEQALTDVSFEDEKDLWDSIVTKLEAV